MPAQANSRAHPPPVQDEVIWLDLERRRLIDGRQGQLRTRLRLRPRGHDQHLAGVEVLELRRRDHVLRMRHVQHRWQAVSGNARVAGRGGQGMGGRASATWLKWQGKANTASAGASAAKQQTAGMASVARCAWHGFASWLPLRGWHSSSVIQQGCVLVKHIVERARCAAHLRTYFHPKKEEEGEEEEEEEEGMHRHQEEQRTMSDQACVQTKDSETHMLAHAHTDTHTRACTQAHTHTCSHTHTHVLAQRHTCSHTGTHTHVLAHRHM